MICFAAVQSVNHYLRFSLTTEQTLISEYKSQLSQYVNLIRGNLRFFINQNDTQRINDQLSALSTINSVKEAALITPQQLIIASARKNQLNKQVKDVITEFPEYLISSTFSSEEGNIYNNKKCQCFFSAHPIFKKHINKPLSVSPHILIIKYSYDLPLQVAFQNVEIELKQSLSYTLIVAALLTFLFHKLITQKVNKLVSVTEKIARGSFSSRTNFKGEDEIGQLGKSIDLMATSLNESNKQLHLQQKALDSHSIVAITDDKGTINFVNDKFCEISQYSREELLGSNHRMINSGIHPKSFFTKLWKRISSGGIWHGEIINRKKDGSLYYVETTIVPFLDDKGIPSQFVAIRTDLTPQKETQQKLEQAQKMETMGQLTGGIAHDFNNILASIMGYTELSILKVNSNDVNKLPIYLEQIRLASERARNLISQMLMFSKLGTEQDSTANIAVVISEVNQLLMSAMPADIDIKTNVPENLPPVDINPTRLHQVFMNLCINARDSIIQNGKIHITVTANKKISSSCTSCKEKFSGEYIYIKVSDNGDGIDEKIINDIFDPFFTTKKDSNGTGIGLAVTRDIIHEAHGHIRVTSRTIESIKHSENKDETGTTFHLYIPPLSTAKSAAMRYAEDITESLKGKNQRILIVDDEAMIAQFESELLTSHGYQPSTHIDSTKALKRFEFNPNEFDLFILDQTMPTLSGLDLAAAILKSRPTAPIILCTGYSEAVDKNIAAQAGIQGFLTKPIDSTTLLKLIQKLLINK